MHFIAKSFDRIVKFEDRYSPFLVPIIEDGYGYRAFEGFIERSEAKEKGYKLVKIKAESIHANDVIVLLNENECVMGAAANEGVRAVIENGRILKMAIGRQ